MAENKGTPMSLKAGWASWRELHRTDPGEFWHSLLFVSFWLHIAFFPLGYGFREVMPCINFIFLLLYYRYRWHESVLRHLPVLPLFGCFFLMIVLGVVFSTNPMDSLMHACIGLNKAYILPFIVMECVHRTRDLKRLVAACVVALFWEGIDGVWQWFTGYDFIMGYPLHFGRLTSSLDDYWVGNYVALMLIPAFGFWYMCRRRFSFLRSVLLYCAVFWPAYFLFVGAAARAGMLALAGALFLWFLISRQGLSWAGILVPLLVAGVFYGLQIDPTRMDMQTVMVDGRWSLWHLAWAVFRAHPIMGAGIWQYNSAFRALGLAPERDEITITHPHDIFLDLLCSHGIVGTALGLIFLFGMVIWGMRILLPRLAAVRKGRYAEDGDAPGSSALYWQLTGLFFMGYVGWILNGVFGHDFYRNWWLSLAMIFLGTAIGAIIQGLRGEAGREERSGKRACPGTEK